MKGVRLGLNEYEVEGTALVRFRIRVRADKPSHARDVIQSIDDLNGKIEMVDCVEIERVKKVKG